MRDDRRRVSIDLPYAEALGLAAFCFARCEWDAVWCCELLQPGYIATIKVRRKTAGTIAAELIDLIDGIANPVIQAKCTGPAVEFQRLVRERNGLLHGKPASALNGDQRLFRHGSEWTIAAVDAFSDEVTACQILLNDLVHVHLVTP
jgi:hypothetical protein